MNIDVDELLKLTRDERNAIMGMIKSYREEAEYYKAKCKESTHESR